MRGRLWGRAAASALIAGIAASGLIQPALGASPGSVDAVAPCLAQPTGLSVSATEGAPMSATLATFGAPTQDQLFIAQAYLDLLKRAPTCLELDTIALLMSGGATPSQVANTIVGSAEYLQNEVVGFYSTFLGRSPTISEESVAITAMQGGATEADIEEAIIGSGEYLDQFLTLGDVVTAVYQELLGRSPTASEVTAGAILVMASGADDLAKLILLSNEYATNATNSLFSELLGRAPTIQESPFFVSAFTSGTAYRVIVAYIAGSAEYFNNQSPPSYTASINWGDGTPASPAAVTPIAGGYSAAGAHTYAEEGSYQATVTVSPSIGSAFSIDAAVTVSDAALTAAGVVLTPDHGRLIAGKPVGPALVATFTDANPAGTASDFTAAIDWGDSTPSTAGTITANPAGGFLVTGDHTYASRGDYEITVVVTDVGGSQASALSSASLKGRP